MKLGQGNSTPFNKPFFFQDYIEINSNPATRNMNSASTQLRRGK